jgi:hypothetical protein
MTTVILQSEAKRGAGAQRLAGGVGVPSTNLFDQTGAEQIARACPEPAEGVRSGESTESSWWGTLVEVRRQQEQVIDMALPRR